ncbi:hypothetical protein [Dyadobacter linearis]|nr:hypothetical protein [Dyadobacter sp. CECT 9623]
MEIQLIFKNLIPRIFPFALLTLAIVGCDACDTRLRHIDARGKIVGSDQCANNTQQVWLMDINMPETVLPNTNMIFPLGADTVNGVYYTSLVRVFVDLKDVDTMAIHNGNQFQFKLNPTDRECSLSPYQLSSYQAFGEYGFIEK